MDRGAEREKVTVLQTSLTTSTCKDLRAETTYELVLGTDSDGNTVPVTLGRGRFAKVYKAWQRSAGHNVRPVAIKVLHENLERRSELLFLQEIGLLKKTTAAPAGHVITILDILQLGPMAMCGSCGQIYHPRCPQCGEYLLERFDPPTDAYPALRCRNHGRCKYIVSGETILNSSYALFQHPSKLCCAKDKGARAQRGTLINFVDRDAVVMELLDEGLTQFHDNRRRTYARLCISHGIHVPGLLDEGDDSPVDLAIDASEPRVASPPETAFVQRVMLLEKMLLMVQLAQSIAWLHGEQQIIHKDLAPDNIMVRTLPVEAHSDWRGLTAGSLTDALTSLATCPAIDAKVIDLGLADQITLSRNWYEEPVQNFATEKLSYLSLEARHRKRRINPRIEFDVMARQFIVPDSLRPDKAGELSMKVGDLLVDETDPKNMYCLEIKGIQQDAQDRRIFRASYIGEVPPSPHSRQWDLVHRLGEAHDLYALGAVFYFILTGEHTEVRKLTNIADLLQETPIPLRAEALQAAIPSYSMRREQLPEKFYQDELMILILRAMVRGQEESFSKSRIERGPEPARLLLHETRNLYNRLKADLLSEPVRAQLQDLELAHKQQLGSLNQTQQQQREDQAQQLVALRQTQDALVINQQISTELLQRRTFQLAVVAVVLALAGFGGGLVLSAPKPMALGPSGLSPSRARPGS